MAAARVAAVFVALICVELSAQPAPQGNVTIQVTDRSGAVVPGARIEIDHSPSKPGSVLTTDSQGRAALDLTIGVHTLSITFPPFRKWSRQIDIQNGVSQFVDAQLDSSGVIIDWVTVSSNASGPPLLRPEPAFLPTQPLVNLAPRPLRSAKRRW
jgi:Carboxypeptidase regulatory-like domain